MNENPIGFILANGEKIGEWINWLTFCKYNNELVAYSIYSGTDFSKKDDILTAPSPIYSILEVKTNEDSGKKSVFLDFNNPIIIAF